jgi:hypothetical protein
MKLPNLRVTEVEKFENDKQWFKDFIDYIRPFNGYGTNLIRDFPQKQKGYRIYNNDIRFEDVKQIINPMNYSKENFEEELLPFNLIPKIVNELIGEELKRNETYEFILTSQEAITFKNHEYSTVIENYIEKKLNLLLQLELSKHEIELSEMKDDEKKSKIQEIQNTVQSLMPDKPNSDFLSQKEIIANKIIKWAWNTMNLKQIKNECFKDALITDEEMVYVGVERNRPIINKINPLFILYQKSPQIKYIQDGDWAGYSYPVTKNDIINHWGHLLSDTDLENLSVAHITKDMTFNKEIQPYHHSQFPDYDQMFFGTMNNFLFNDPFLGDYGTGNSIQRFYQTYQWVTHFEWKAFKKVGYINTINMYGEEVTDLVDETFKVPKSAIKSKFVNRFGDDSEHWVWFVEDKAYTLEWMWIPRKYEVTRIGRNIFVNAREVPFQTTNIENPFTTCKLSYHGRVLTATNAQQISLVERMYPLNTLYMISMNMLTKHIARYKGVLQNIDTSMVDINLSASKDPAEALEVTLKYIDLGYKIYNSVKDFESGDNVVTNRPAPSMDNASNAGDLLNVIRIVEWLSMEIGNIVGVSPQRLAQMTANNVSDNQQSLVQSTHITEYYFNSHSELWKEISLSFVQVFIIWMKKWFEDNPNKQEYFLNYVMPDGTKELMSLNGEILNETDYGVYAMLSGAAKQYFDSMANLAHALIQNEQMTVGDISSLLLAMNTGATPTEIHNKMIKSQEAANARKQQMQQQQLDSQNQQSQLQSETQKQIMQMQIENREDEQLHQMAMQERKYEHEKEIKAMDVYKFQQELDANNNGIPDPIEAAKLQADINLKERKLSNERSQQFDEIKHQDDLTIKKEKLKVDLSKARKPNNK